ncbi:hypothetical protein ABH922_002504 [Rhodococcus sp. 27YEA15]|uniref:DUF4132 domain-containing protein n=1 Tax=Rhodococcus sp. 27YEA15 TaxID=3156259 RepID=UPI003C7E3539
MNHRETNLTDGSGDSESAFAPPAAWIPMKLPRRGGFTADVDPVDSGAGTALEQAVETNEAYLKWVSWELVNDPEPNALVTAARSYLAGDVSAIGAAAFHALIAQFLAPGDGRLVVDGWVARHGMPFAVEALLLSSDLRKVHIRVEKIENSSTWERRAVLEFADSPVVEGDVYEADATRYTYVEQLVRYENLHDQLTGTPREHMLERMRALLATASDDEYADAFAVASTLRTGTTRRLTASFLFPTERRWSEDLITGFDEVPYHWHTQLIASSNTAIELQRSSGSYGRLTWIDDEDVLAAAVDGVGIDIVPLLTDAFDSPNHYTTAENDTVRLRVLDALSAIPSDCAFTALVERAHTKNALPAMTRASAHFPRRAFRILAQTNSELLDRHIRKYPDLAAQLAHTLPQRARRRIEELATIIPEATDLPTVLADPPWSSRKQVVRTQPVEGLRTAPVSRLDWLPGELEELRNTPHEYSYTEWEQYRQYIRDHAASGLNEWQAWVIFLIAPDDVARPLLTQWPGDSLKAPLRVVARFGMDALPLMLQFARARPGAAAPYLMPFVDLDVARLQATTFATRKNLRKSALSWLIRHAADAVTLLVPDAVGPIGSRRDHAEAALRALSRATSRKIVVGGAAQYGSATADAVAQLVDLDPLEVLPKRVPKIPTWADLESLPRILTADRSAVLPVRAVSSILTMCAVSTADAPYAGLEITSAFCDRPTLAAAAWELFERWWGSGAPSKDNWVILALGLLGDDSTIARLAPLVRRWPGEGGAVRAQLGLDALAASGSARALTELDHISRKVKFASLRNGARQRVTEIADTLGLDLEQLADRTVPDLDLAPDGTTTFDFGPRSFTVGFTETLVPFVRDEAGKKTAGLPKPIATDDPELADAARKRFAGLKREAKAVAAEQIKRFNRSMVIGRRWSGDEFTEFVLRHPLLIHIARRLLWAAFDGNSRPTVVFRVTEDDTFVDVDGNTVELPDRPIGLVHPAHIPDTIGAWSELFSDCAVLQPFPQLDRPVHHLLPGDVDGSGLVRFTGVTATASQALRLTFRGWEPVWENPASWGQGLRYQLTDTVSVLLGLEPGMGTGDPYHGYPDQTLVSVQLRGGTLDDVDPATASELVADLAGFAS